MTLSPLAYAHVASTLGCMPRVNASGVVRVVSIPQSKPGH